MCVCVCVLLLHTPRVATESSPCRVGGGQIPGVRRRGAVDGCFQLCGHNAVVEAGATLSGREMCTLATDGIAISDSQFVFVALPRRRSGSIRVYTPPLLKQLVAGDRVVDPNY